MKELMVNIKRVHPHFRRSLHRFEESEGGVISTSAGERTNELIQEKTTTTTNKQINKQTNSSKCICMDTVDTEVGTSRTEVWRTRPQFVAAPGGRGSNRIQDQYLPRERT